MGDAEPENAANGAVRRGRAFLGSAYRQADSLIDIGQSRAFRFLWFFLPEPGLAKELRFQAVLVSRFLSDAGQQALAYGALIAVVRNGGSAFDAALLGVAALLPPALLGLYGGAVADALPKRAALAGIYNLQALLCFTAPSVLGTDLKAMMFLLFAVNALGQVSGPSEQSVLPMVANEAQLATAAALISFASSLGTAFGTALLAPVLVRAFGVTTVIYTAGALLLLAATRVFDLRSHEAEPEPETHLDMDLLRRKVSIRATVVWLAEQPAVATMIFVAVVAGTAQIVLQTLAPRYVQAVLDADPADAVYVFAPSAAGLALALFSTPRLIRSRGERNTALLGFSLVSTSLVLLGLVAHLGVIESVNPLLALEWFGLDLGERLRTAAFVAFFLGFGMALTTTSVQTYINRRVPLAVQGRTFALQSTLKNGTAIIPLVSLGAAAGVFGVESVLVVSPLFLFALAAGLVQLSRHFGGHAPRGRLDVLSTFWAEPPVETQGGAALVIRSLYLDEQAMLRRDLSTEAMRKTIASGKGVLWVDMMPEGDEERGLLTEVFAFHPLAVEDCYNDRVEPPKIDDYGAYLFIVSQCVEYAGVAERLDLRELNLFLGPNYVVTCRQRPISPVDELFDRACENDHLVSRGADFLAHTILDSIVDLLLPAVEAMDEQIDDLEQRILDSPEKSLLPEVLLLKRNTLRLRRSILPQRDMVNRLSRGEFGALISRDALIFYRDVYDHIVRVEEMLEGLRDLADGALGSYLSSVNNRMNEIMKAMSIVAVIFLPLTLIASIYGTNLDFSPFGLSFKYGFLLMLASMLVVSGGLISYFRRRGWF